MSDEIVTLGGPVKALDNGRIGGYLVRFSGPSEPDLTGEYFDAQTDFWDAKTAPILYDHGLTKQLGNTRFGKVELRVDDVGVWAEGEISRADAYAKKVREMVEAGKIAWSSGSSNRLVEYDNPVKGIRRIKTWPIIEASLTPTPAEPRGTRVLPLKSYHDARLRQLGKSVKAGRVLSSATRSRLRAICDEIEAFLGEADAPEPAADKSVVPFPVPDDLSLEAFLTLSRMEITR